MLPYLLLKQSDESFMHRKLKNTAVEYMDEGGDETKQQENNEVKSTGKENAKGTVRGKERNREKLRDRDKVREAD